MDFNVTKCGVMRIVKINLKFQYQMNDDWVKSVDEERDLGVLMSKDLKFSKQYILAKNNANLMLDIINRGISYKSAELYRSYVRSHLEYCTQFWSPISDKDADMLESTEKSI